MSQCSAWRWRVIDVRHATYAIELVHDYVLAMLVRELDRDRFMSTYANHQVRKAQTV